MYSLRELLGGRELYGAVAEGLGIGEYVSPNLLELFQPCPALERTDPSVIHRAFSIRLGEELDLKEHTALLLGTRDFKI
jgi:hypothetical protein